MSVSDNHPVEQQPEADYVSVDALDNEEITVDFKPLYQCIHIYETLERTAELQRSYQGDRKVSSRQLISGVT